MPTTEKIAETDEGQADLKGNELIVTDKTTGDPCAIGAVSANGGICKWNIRAKRPDGSIVEIGYLFGKQDERYPGQQVGEMEFWLKAPNQAAADTKVFGIRHDGVVFYVGASASGPMMQLWDGTGIYFAQMQNDGGGVFNFVAYKASTPFSIGNPEAVLFSMNDILARLTAAENRLAQLEAK